MTPRLGQAVLGLSAAGFPLTQLAIRRFGRRGAIVAEGVCLGLLVRDGAMIAAGAPRRLRRGPALLLWLEFGAALVAVLAASLRPSTRRLRPGPEARAPWGSKVCGAPLSERSSACTAPGSGPTSSPTGG